VESFFKFGRAMDQGISHRLALDRSGFGPRSDGVSFVVSKVAMGTALQFSPVISIPWILWTLQLKIILMHIILLQCILF